MLRRNFLILAAGILAGSLALAAPSYYPAALGDFDGAADYLHRGSDLTGNAGGKLGIVSTWLRIDGGDGSTLEILHSTTDIQFFRNSGNVFQIYLRDAVNAVALDLKSATIYKLGTTWRHILASWDAGNGVSHLYVNDSEDADEVTNADKTIDYRQPAWAIGAASGGGAYFNGAVSETYINFAEYLDLSIEANRRKFISSTGFPVDLGPSCSTPTGTAPIVCMRERANNGGINSGTGGDFTINGAPIHTDGPAGPYFPFTTEIPARGRGSRMHRQELFQ